MVFVVALVFLSSIRVVGVSCQIVVHKVAHGSAFVSTGTTKASKFDIATACELSIVAVD